MRNKPGRFRKKPVEIEAVQWTGDNWYFLREWTDNKFNVLDEEDRADDPDATAELLDELHSTWVLVYDNDWIIRGGNGEFYLCRDKAFRETYEEVTETELAVLDVSKEGVVTAQEIRERRKQNRG